MDWLLMPSKFFNPMLVICGFYLLISSYFLQGRIVWMDEAMLARNIIERSFLNLTYPLSYQQSAPLIYLQICKLAFSIYQSELSLRLVSMLFGLITVVAFVTITIKRGVDTPTIWLSSLTLITNVYFVRYSTEIKPYILDALLILLIPPALRYAFNNQGFNLSTVFACVITCVSPWLSNLSVLVIPITVFSLIINQQKIHLRTLLYISAAYFISATSLYFLVVKNHPLKRFMVDYWVADGALFAGGALRDIVRFVYLALTKFSLVSTGLNMGILSLILVVVGILLAFRDRHLLVLMLVNMAQLGLALLQIYPFSQRLALSVVTFVPLSMISASDTCIFPRMREVSKHVFFTLLLAINVSTLARSNVTTVDPIPVDLVMSIVRNTDVPVYVSLGAADSVKYYTVINQVVVHEKVTFGGTLDRRQIIGECINLGRTFILIHTHATGNDIDFIVGELAKAGYHPKVKYSLLNSVILECEK